MGRRLFTVLIVALGFLFASPGIASAREDLWSWLRKPGQDLKARGIKHDVELLRDGLGLRSLGSGSSLGELSEAEILSGQQSDEQFDTLLRRSHLQLTRSHAFPEFDDHNGRMPLFLEQQVTFAEAPRYEQLQFIGVHRFWVRYVRRFLRDYLVEDRESFIDQSSNPGRAARIYDQKFQEFSFDQQFLDPWWQGSPWEQGVRREIYVVGTRRNVAQTGPFIVTGGLRLRVDLNALPEVKRWMRSYGLSTQSASKRDYRRASAADAGAPKRHRYMRLKMGLKVGFGGSTIVRKAGLRFAIFCMPFRHRKTLIPAFVTVRRDLIEGEWEGRFTVILFHF